MWLHIQWQGWELVLYNKYTARKKLWSSHLTINTIVMEFPHVQVLDDVDVEKVILLVKLAIVLLQ